MTEKSHPLGRRGVAASRVAALELEWNIADTHPGGADQDLEQDLEPDRSELDALDCRSLAQEISRERVRGLAGFAEERLDEPSREVGEQLGRVLEVAIHHRHYVRLGQVKPLDCGRSQAGTPLQRAMYD